MKKMIIKLLVTALSILAVAYFIPGIVVENFYTALVVAVVLGLLNLFVRPILIILTLPITMLTLGLFTFIINGFLLWFIGTVVKGFAASCFLLAVLGALIISAFSWLAERLFFNAR